MKDSLEISEKELKKFGLLMGSVSSVFCLVALWKASSLFVAIFSIPALAFLGFALTSPSSLAIVHRKWMRFAEVLGAFNAKVILALVYVLVFTPIHGLFKLMGKDPLQRKLEPDAKTYWEDHAGTNRDRESYERQY